MYLEFAKESDIYILDQNVSKVYDIKVVFRLKYTAYFFFFFHYRSFSRTKYVYTQFVLLECFVVGFKRFVMGVQGAWLTGNDE